MQRENVAVGLVESRPIPGLAGRRIVLPDIDQLVALADLALRAVKHDPNPVLAVEKLHVIKYIALVGRRLGKAEQLFVAVQLGFPSGGQVAFEAGSVEGRLASSADGW